MSVCLSWKSLGWKIHHRQHGQDHRGNSCCNIIISSSTHESLALFFVSGGQRQQDCVNSLLFLCLKVNQYLVSCRRRSSLETPFLLYALSSTGDSLCKLLKPLGVIQLSFPAVYLSSRQHETESFSRSIEFCISISLENQLFMQQMQSQYVCLVCWAFTSTVSLSFEIFMFCCFRFWDSDVIEFGETFASTKFWWREESTTCILCYVRKILKERKKKMKMHLMKKFS